MRLDSRFGQRYHLAKDSSRVVWTRQRQQLEEEISEKARDCDICVESKAWEEYPPFSITASCDHAPRACLQCVSTAIRTDLGSKVWTQLGCLECGVLLEYADVERFADRETFERYARRKYGNVAEKRSLPNY